MKSWISISSSTIPVTLAKEIPSNHTRDIFTFEAALEAYYLNKKKIVALSSGTAAIHLALLLAGVQKEDEVLCASFTYVASANPIVYVGARPVFIDSEKDTWNMCPKYLEAAIVDRIHQGKKPKAIIVVHLYGMPAKIDQILRIAQQYKIVLIEDAAEALGASYKGQPCGTFGDYGILSFNTNKIISTFGGGALFCTTQKEKDKALFFATQARDPGAHYEHSEIGYNYRLSPLLAGIGCDQMDVLEKNIGLRRGMHQFYKELFKDVEGVSLLEEPSKDYFSNHWLSCILIDEAKTSFSKEELRLQLEKDQIESRVLWKPMHIQPVFKEAAYYGAGVAEELFRNGLCLPSGSNLTNEDRERISDSIHKIM